MAIIYLFFQRVFWCRVRQVATFEDFIWPYLTNYVCSLLCSTVYLLSFRPCNSDVPLHHQFSQGQPKGLPFSTRIYGLVLAAKTILTLSSYMLDSSIFKLLFTSHSHKSNVDLHHSEQLQYLSLPIGHLLKMAFFLGSPTGRPHSSLVSWSLQLWGFLQLQRC